jgi:hypothetical protein
MLHRPCLLGCTLLVATAALGATGCGSSSPSAGTKSAAQIVPAMKAAADSATSVRMTGTTKVNSTTFTYDMSFVGNTDMSGSLTQGSTSLTLEVVAGKTYIKINQGFLSIASLPASDCSSICGKWVEVPTAEASQVTGSFNLSGLRKQVFGTMPSDAIPAGVEFVPGTYHGQPVLTASGDGYTVDVAKTGPTYPVFISDSTGDDVAFSEWNSVPPLTPPPASEVITI